MNTFLRKGTLILTRNTNDEICYTPIEDITKGITVLTHWGFWKPVTNIQTTDITEGYLISGKGMLPTMISKDSKILIKNSIVDTIEWREIDKVKDSNFSAFVLPREHDNIEDKEERFNYYLVDSLKIQDEKEIDGYHSFINGSYLFRKIDNVKSTSIDKETFYGLEIEEENTFIANGMIVHG